MRTFGEAPYRRRREIHPHAPDAFGFEPQAPARNGTRRAIRKLDDLSLPAQGTDHGAKDLKLIRLPKVPEGQARNNRVDGAYACPGEYVRCMRRLSATDLDTRKLRLEKSGQHRIALDNEQALRPKSTAKEGSRDRARAGTDLEHRRLRRIHPRSHQPGQLSRTGN